MAAGHVRLPFLCRAPRLIMLICPSCGTDDPEDLSVDATLGGYFANDFLADKVELTEVHHYLSEAMDPAQSRLGCSACGYEGHWDEATRADMADSE